MTPFDERLQMLRYVKQLWKILLVTLVGAVVCTGLYWCIANHKAGPHAYQAKSYYWTTYVVEFEGYDEYYVNHYTWGTILRSDLFLAQVEEWLLANAPGVWNGSRETLAQMITVDVESDVHMPCSVVTGTDASLVYTIAGAIEAVLTENYAVYNDQIVQITLMDDADVTEAPRDIRTRRAFILSAVLIFFFLTVYLLLYQLSDEGIYLPGELEEAAGIRCAGYEADPNLAANLQHIFAGKKTAWLDIDSEDDPGACKQRLEQREGCGSLVSRMTVVPSPLLCSDAGEALQEMEAILLVVPAGPYRRLQLEQVLRFLRAQDLQADAVLLRDADEMLIRSYYRIRKDT